MANVAKDLAQLISQSKSTKTGPYDTQAVVKRIEGNTVWVSIPGGIDETPIEKTINCTAGDKVQVRVSGGRAWITGNASAPPTDDKTANEAKTKAVVAEATAIDAKETADAVEGIAVSASTTATTAKTIAEGVNEHFWYDSGGAHVTEVTQAEWSDPGDPNYHSGGNTLITSLGMAIRNGLNNLAEFTSSHLQLGEKTNLGQYIGGPDNIEISNEQLDLNSGENTVLRIKGDGIYVINEQYDPHDIRYDGLLRFKLDDDNYIELENNSGLFSDPHMHLNHQGPLKSNSDTILTHAGLIVTDESASTGSVTASSDSGSLQIPLANPGYIPIGIVGYNMAGSNRMYQNIYACIISDRLGVSPYVGYRFRNNATVAFNGTFHAYILWAAE